MKNDQTKERFRGFMTLNDTKVGSEAYKANKLEIKQKYQQCLRTYGLEDQLPK